MVAAQDAARQFGVVTTLAGLAGVEGSADGPGSQARFSTAFGITADAAGNVYVADSYNDTIRKIDVHGVVSTLAGIAKTQGSVDGIGSAARLASPAAITVDASGNLFVADDQTTIRKITAALRFP